jgi:hypothetical protein
MSAIQTRLANLEFTSKAKKKKGVHTFVEEIREMLERIDGIAELGTVPGEDLEDEMMRRMEGEPGFSLARMPGDTLKAKIQAVDEAAQGKLTVSPEARHAARGYFSLYDGL